MLFLVIKSKQCMYCRNQQTNQEYIATEPARGLSRGSMLK